MSYIDLVACKHPNDNRAYLFKAPQFSHLEKGDKVIVETKNGEKEVEVITTYTIGDNEDDLWSMFIALSGAEIPLKRVLRKITYREYKYEEEES